MVSLDRQDQIIILKLDHGITNAIDLELVEELEQALQGVMDDKGIRALTLTSASDKFFSIGFDIPALIALSRPDFETFYREFNRLCLDLYTFPKPTVAALRGHAIAGGCILALCCDYRLVGAGKKLIGLNEVKLGVPAPYLADCILRQLVGVLNARQIVELGEFYAPEDALRLGLVDQICDPQVLLQEAITKAALLGSSPGPAFSLIKRNRTEILEAQVLSRWDAKQSTFIDCWYSEPTRRLLKEAAEKF
ncbi:MAG: enoyl-CoA hydratase/isomerase family protein [Anaerolineales bacterium]|nr:enoyl-CoA hydratase/isomerase family protein [Anaerolineales bacterium]